MYRRSHHPLAPRQYILPPPAPLSFKLGYLEQPSMPWRSKAAPSAEIGRFPLPCASSRAADWRRCRPCQHDLLKNGLQRCPDPVKGFTFLGSEGALHFDHDAVNRSRSGVVLQGLDGAKKTQIEGFVSGLFGGWLMRSIVLPVAGKFCLISRNTSSTSLRFYISRLTSTHGVSVVPALLFLLFRRAARCTVNG